MRKRELKGLLISATNHENNVFEQTSQAKQCFDLPKTNNTYTSIF